MWKITVSSQVTTYIRTYSMRRKSGVPVCSVVLDKPDKQSTQYSATRWPFRSERPYCGAVCIVLIATDGYDCELFLSFPKAMVCVHSIRERRMSGDSLLLCDVAPIPCQRWCFGFFHVTSTWRAIFRPHLAWGHYKNLHDWEQSYNHNSHHIFKLHNMGFFSDDSDQAQASSQVRIIITQTRAFRWTSP